MTLTWPGFAPGPLTRGPPAQLGLERPAQPVRISAGLGEQPGDDALGLVQQGEQQVLAVHFGVPEAQRLGLRVVQRFLLTSGSGDSGP